MSDAPEQLSPWAVEALARLDKIEAIATQLKVAVRVTTEQRDTAADVLRLAVELADVKAQRDAALAEVERLRTEPRRAIFAEIDDERRRQDAKWGPVTRAYDVDPVLAARGASPMRIAAEHEIPTEARAKQLCDLAAKQGVCTYTHIVVEELAEAVAAHADKEAMRSELVQLAASVVKWIEGVDLDLGKPAPAERDWDAELRAIRPGAEWFRSFSRRSWAVALGREISVYSESDADPVGIWRDARACHPGISRLVDERNAADKAGAT